MELINSDSSKNIDQKLERLHVLLNFASNRKFNLPRLKLEEIEVFILQCESMLDNLSYRQELILLDIRSMWKKQINNHVTTFDIEASVPKSKDHTYKLSPWDIKLLKCGRIDTGARLLIDLLTKDDIRFLKSRRIKPD